MRSTRASAAWSALAVTTSLLGVAIMSAHTQTPTDVASAVTLTDSRPASPPLNPGPTPRSNSDH